MGFAALWYIAMIPPLLLLFLVCSDSSWEEHPKVFMQGIFATIAVLMLPIAIIQPQFIADWFDKLEKDHIEAVKEYEFTKAAMQILEKRQQEELEKIVGQLKTSKNE